MLAGFTIDITERKRAEEEKAKLEVQLQQVQKLESVGRLAGGVAHDFNNMLGVILGHTELALMQTSPSNPLHADLVEVQNAAQTLCRSHPATIGFCPQADRRAQSIGP